MANEVEYLNKTLYIKFYGKWDLNGKYIGNKVIYGQEFMIIQEEYGRKTIYLVNPRSIMYFYAL
jgi:hypothetical protein